MLFSTYAFIHTLHDYIYIVEEKNVSFVRSSELIQYLLRETVEEETGNGGSPRTCAEEE